MHRPANEARRQAAAVVPAAGAGCSPNAEEPRDVVLRNGAGHQRGGRPLPPSQVVASAAVWHSSACCRYSAVLFFEDICHMPRVKFIA